LRSVAAIELEWLKTIAADPKPNATIRFTEAAYLTLALKENTKARAFLIVGVVYAVCLEIFSLLPGKASVEDDCGLCWDVSNATANALHFLVYAGFAWLLYGNLAVRNKQSRGAFVLTILATAAIGIFNEFLQVLVPGRYASVSDALLNTLGGSAGAWLSFKMRILMVPG